jgi:hypothetical protein
MSDLKRKISDKTNLSDQENESPAEKKVKKVAPNQFGHDLSNKITATVITHLEQTKCVIFEESPDDSDEKEPSLDENNNVVATKTPVFLDSNERRLFEKIFKEVRSISTSSNHDQAEPQMPGLFISFYDLIVNAHKADTAEFANHFKDLAIQLLEPKFMQKLVNRFVRNFDAHKSCNAVVDLIRCRIQWIETFISRGDPEETWHMPNARIPGYPEVEEFLISGRKTQRFVIGSNKDAARNFCNLYSGVNDDYSVSMSPAGWGTNAFVEMDKGRNYYVACWQRHRAIVAEYKEEHAILTDLLNDQDSQDSE